MSSNVAKIFDRIAARYDDHAIVPQKMGDALLNRLDFMKITPRTVLDLGTGTGHCLPGLLARYPEAALTALDISPAMLAQAQQKMGEAPIEWICADFFENPLPGRSFDLILANGILPCVDSIAGFFQRCLSALNPEGVLFFSGLGVDSLQELKKASLDSGTGEHVNHFYDIHDLGDALVHLGYTDPVLDLQYIVLEYSTLDRLWNELKGAGSYLHAPSRQSCMGKNAWQRLCAAYPKTVGGKYPVTFELVYGHARRGDMILRKHKPGEPIYIPLSELKRK